MARKATQSKEERQESIKANIALTIRNNTTEEFEDDSEGDDEGRAFFFIHNGKEELRVKALKDCWAIQRFSQSTNSKTGEVSESWSGFKYVTDLGSVANRIYEMRLKNSEASTLKELSEFAIKIGSDIREEFRYKKERK